MRLPASTVTIESVGPALPNGLVPIMLAATNTSLYVTLTCAVAGRFSVRAEGIWPPRLLPLIRAWCCRQQNAFLMAQNQPPPLILFLPWGEFGASQLATLKSSLRVEHLQENL